MGEKLAAHHDALEFPDGRTVLLTLLCEGQAATVLQLPAQPKTEVEAREQERAGFVVEVQTALTVPCRCKAAGNKKERFDAARWCRVRIPFVDPPAMRTNNAIKTGLSFSGQANMLRLFSRSANVRDAFQEQLLVLADLSATQRRELCGVALVRRIGGLPLALQVSRGATTSELSNNRTASATQTLARWSFPDWALIGQLRGVFLISTYFKYFPHPQCPCRFRQTSPAIYPASL